MNNTILEQILALKEAFLADLQKKYSEVFDGKKAPSNNKTYLWQRIAYRIQELEYGSLPEEAKDKVKQIAEEYDPINNKVLRPDASKRRKPWRDGRLPVPGTIINKNYKGRDITVKVLDIGFEYDGKVYKTLTAIAKEITGSHWNGYLFFGM
jgi:hypothetical protein